MSEFFFYIFIYSVSLGLFRIGKYNPIFEKIGLFLVIALSIFRFDIGNDYENYYDSISFSTTYLRGKDIGSILELIVLLGVEPFLELLCFLFKDFQHPPLYVIGTYAFLTILIWYRLLRKIDGVFWGFFLIFTFSILFISYDQIRQALAASIFLCSYKYIELRDWKRYLYIVLLASCVHYSVLLVSPAYFILRWNPQIKLYILVILIFYVGFLLGTWIQFRESLFSLVSLYAEYAENERQLSNPTFGSGLGLLFQVLVYVYLMVKLATKYPILSNSLFIGSILVLFASGNLNINRVAYYFSFATIMAFPLYMKSETQKVKVVALSLLMTVYCVRNLYEGINGCVPYDSVWEENFQRLNFRVREYKLE